MAKVTINGEVFGFDGTRKPLSEAVALEEALGTTHGQWEADLAAGSARALCGFVWLVWRRNGRDVPLAEILDGEPEIDLNGFSVEPDGESPPPTKRSPSRRRAG